MKFFSVLIRIFNGKIEIIGKENLPKDEKFLLVAPHRTYLDPVFIAISAYPHEFAFMGKKELFDIPLFGKIIRKINAFPVNREKPGASAIKIPVNYLRNNELNVLIFPTGSRYSTKVKPGAIKIAQLSKRKVVPVVYTGPMTLKELLLRKKAIVHFGESFEVERKIKDLDNINEHYANFIEEKFDELDQKNYK